MTPVTLAGWDVRLVPLAADHASALGAAAADGELWRSPLTSVPAPGEELSYIATALATPDRQAFAVLDDASGLVLGSTSYHDVVPAVRRLEIGYTWYGRQVQRTHVNTACKLMLLTHAFESLGAEVVGWRTDRDNLASRRAIERLGARLDGVLRHHAQRRDGTVRDTAMYSLLATEWPDVKNRLVSRLAAGAPPGRRA